MDLFGVEALFCLPYSPVVQTPVHRMMSDLALIAISGGKS